MSVKALERHLLPFTPFLEMDGVTEICINQSQEIFVEKEGLWNRHVIPELEYNFLATLAALVAEFNHKDFPAPLIAGRLPTRERIQFVMHPGCESRKIICAIRRQQIKQMRLEDYDQQGAFSVIANNNGLPKKDDNLRQLFHKGNLLEFITEAIRERKNILISGGTGTGKTTFLNACLECIPLSERILTVEDTREVKVVQPNVAHLLFNEDDKAITSLEMFKVCLRLRPDRIFLSELRGAEVWPYLRAANSGHPGSLSTVHADTPEGAFTQLMFMMQQAGSTSSEEQIMNYIKSIIHVVIQLKRDTNSDRFMHISEVYFAENK